jgi:hypothetical protein
VRVLRAHQQYYCLLGATGTSRNVAVVADVQLVTVPGAERPQSPSGSIAH